MKKTKSHFVRISNSSIHNSGAFARRNIRKGQRIIEYVGKRVSGQEADDVADRDMDEAKNDPSKGSVYIFEVNKDFDIDGNVDWNSAKYFNHSCDPNCEVDIKNDRIFVLATRRIKKGEELTYNYGYEYDDDWKDHPCLCGSKNCIGYIMDDNDWDQLKEAIAKDKKKQRKKSQK